MIQDFIFNVIQTVKKLYEKLDSAYQETYADFETAKLAQDEIKRRRKANKKAFIKSAMDFAKVKYRQEHGEDAPSVILRSFAEDMFNIAMEKGDLDELYKMKEERKDSNGRTNQ